ncbi:hypothetical protein OAP56_04675 [Rickettsiaceae bacterium]|nr:hypothetical protein [Rickettsiaceae bacterium]
MIKIFQLKSARSVTGVEVRELALYLGVSRTIVSRWEKQRPLDSIKTKKASPESLVFFFSQHHILFPDENSICFDSKEDSEMHSSHLTRFQFRAARSILDLTQTDLASATNSSRKIVNYLETFDNKALLAPRNKDIDDSVFRQFFESKGITFPYNLSVRIDRSIFTE